ncbi:uncharacterized protein [Choristoneura fumiferana]|uniref:uncharacterized protein n=1 Tax=Choristoneura fumiferana TaxID=7141 RepID=UPI003D15A1AF
MFKLVVLCAFLAVAVAEPLGAYFTQPLTYSSTVISPAVTTISKSASSVVHPSPEFYYNVPTAYTHFIKKRSAPLILPTTYAAGAPFVSTYTTPIVASAPVLSNAHILPAPIAATPIGYTHLIKKRSAPIFASAAYSTYQPLAYSTPLISSAPLVSAGPVYSSPAISHAPIAYSHLIKKRSAQIPVTSYIPSSSVTHQYRLDTRTYPYVTAPLAYSNPLTYSQVY